LRKVENEDEEHIKTNVETGEYSNSIVIKEFNDIGQVNKNSSDKTSIIKVEHEKSSDKKILECVPILTCKLLVEIASCEETIVQDDVFRIWMIFENGSGGLDALQSLRQYLINKLDVREKIVNPSKSIKKRKGKKRKISDGDVNIPVEQL